MTHFDAFHVLTVILAALALVPAVGRVWRSALGLVLHPSNGGVASVEPAGDPGDKPRAGRVLATVLFADIVGSTERAAEIGDRKWRELLEAYQGMVRKELVNFGGREIDTAGDGFLAAFGAPARGIQCARAIRDAARLLGVEIRCGLHGGECELMGEKLGGIAVHIGARVAGKAQPGEILVSQTVRDLVAGSGLQFDDRGAHRLKGVPGEWRLCAFVPSAAA